MTRAQVSLPAVVGQILTGIFKHGTRCVGDQRNVGVRGTVPEVLCFSLDVSPESSVKSKQSRLEGDAPGSPRVAANTPPPLAGSGEHGINTQAGTDPDGLQGSSS